MAKNKVGRNDTCPCGSGKKYKKCCLGRGEGASIATGPRSPAVAGGGTTRASVGALRAWPTPRTKFTPEAALAFARGVPEGADLHPWIIAQIRERLGVGPGGAPPLHTISSVRRLETSAILEALGRAGVEIDETGFHAAAAGHRSAWDVSRAWAGDAHQEAEFYGLAACELWRRLIPDRPSYEMIDERMQQCYDTADADEMARARELWLRCWDDLLDALPADIDSLDVADAVFPGLNSLINWTWDFDLEIRNAAMRNEYLARRGLDLFERIVTRFPSASQHRRNLQLQRAEFLYLTGDFVRGEAQLQALIDEDPDDAGGYAWLSEHLGSRRSPSEYRDIPRAIALLEGALARPVRDPEGYSYRLRLEQLRADLAKGEPEA